MWRGAVTYVVVALGVALSGWVSPAAASDVRNPDQSIPTLERRWINQSNIPSPSVPITIYNDTNGCVGHPLGCAVLQPGAYAIHLAPNQPSSARRWTVRHEAGHIFDDSKMTDTDRAEFLRIIGMGGVAWRQGISPSDQATPQEMFADHYALCAINNRRPPGNSLVQPGYQTPRRHRLICKLIARVSRRPLAPVVTPAPSTPAGYGQPSYPHHQ